TRSKQRAVGIVRPTVGTRRCRARGGRRIKGDGRSSHWIGRTIGEGWKRRRTAAIVDNFDHEDIVRAVGAGIESAERGWKIGRPGEAGHIGGAGSIDGDASTLLLTAAAQKSGVHEGRASRIQLRHKYIANTTIQGSIENTSRRRKISAVSVADHIGGAGSIDGDASTIVDAMASSWRAR